jgi:glycosyltransferase involved in cell wall biosynthesis
VICTGPPDYPLNKQNWSLARALVAQGRRVTLVLDLQREDLVGDSEFGRIESWPSYHPVSVRDFAFFWRLLEDVRPDAILANFHGIYIAMVAGLLRRVPIRVAWYRSLNDQRRLDSAPDSLSRKLFTLPIKSASFRLATHVVAVSAVARDDVCGEYGVRPERCTVITTRRLDPVEELGISHVPSPRSRRIVCVARLVPSKGQDILLRAFARLCELEPDWPAVLELIGDGPERQAYVNLAAELGVRDRVQFSGQVDHGEVFARAARADVMVVPFRTDAGPGVLAEGMGLGLPMVVCAAGAMPELVGDTAAVRLVPPEDPDAMAFALRSILGDFRTREQMSREARELFRRKFHIDSWIEEVLLLLDRASCDAGLASSTLPHAYRR